LKDAVQKGLKLNNLKARLGCRVAFSEALARNLCVEEGNDLIAQAEPLGLAEEVNGILSERKR
jgi:hypothetical protein